MFALFSELRCSTSIGEKARVATTTLTTARRLEACAVRREIREHLPRVHVTNDGALRHLDDEIFTPPTVEVFAHSVDSVARTTVRMIAEREQRGHVVVGLQPNRSAVASVAPVRTTECDRSLATETHAARTAVTTANVQLGLIDESTHRGIPCYG